MDYILGGGISGLIFAYYNPEFQIITPETGGMLGLENSFGSMILWDTIETRQLLENLGLPIVPFRANIHYYFNNKIYSEAPKVLRIEYVIKRMKELVNQTTQQDLALSTDETNYIDGLKVDFKELISRLLFFIGEDRIKKGKVEEIQDDSFYLKDTGMPLSDGWIKYNYLVSTLPAPAFWWMWKGKGMNNKVEEFNCLSTTYVSMDKLKGFVKKILIDTGYLPEDWEYFVYFLNEFPCHRLARTSTGGCAFQFSGDISNESIIDFLQVPKEELKFHTERIGGFITKRDNIPPKNILFLGRNAQWDYKIKIQHVVKVAKYSKFIFDFIRNRQTIFNRNFIDFNNLSIEDRQKLTQKWILHLFGEINELMRETNFKMHKQQFEINKQNILIEWIDIFKFLLGIADIWGFSNQEIIQAFMEKSGKVENDYYNMIKEKEEKNDKR